MAEAVAINVFGVVITSSPGPIPNALKIKWRLHVPFANPAAYLVPQYSANSFSKTFTSSPKTNLPLSKTRSNAFVNSTLEDFVVGPKST